MLGKNLMMLRTYHKSGALFGMDKLIPHSIDGVTADLVIQDLALTRPFAEVAAHICYSDRPAVKEMYQTNLFVNNRKLFSTDQLTATMARVSIPFLGFGLGVNSWRHISTTFKRKLGRFAEDFPDALAGGPEDLLPLFLQASTNWQLVMHTVPGGLQLAYPLTRSHQANTSAAAAAVAPLQGAEVMFSMQNLIMARIEDQLVAGIEHNIVARVVDALVPAVQTIIHDTLVKAMPQQSASHSEDFWPRDEGLKHASQEEAQDVSGSHDAGLVKDKISVLADKSLWTLCVLLQDEWANWWSSKQQDAVLSVLKRETDNIIMMLKTGGGKSMLAIIPAIMDTKRAVVVVLPLKSLMTDWERKLKAMGARFQIYNPTVRLPRDTNLIPVSTDKAKFKTWRQHLAELNEVLPVGRLVFDEAHLPLLAENFREAMRYMQEIREFPMQLVLLSGTIPPFSVATLKASFGLAGNAIKIRESGNRPELEYIMKTPARSNTLESTAIQIVESKRRTWTPEDSGLGNRHVCVLIAASQSGWPFYNGSKEMSNTSRVQCYGDWFTGKCLVMICTSAFSTGNDYPHVRVIIHLKTPLEMMEIIQAQGRGGRDGRPARCYILPSSTPPNITVGQSEVDHKGLQYAHDYIYRYGLNRCLRYGSTLYIDREGTECRRHESNQWCCVCKADPNHNPSQVTAHSEKQDTHSSSANKCTVEHVSDSSDPFEKVHQQAKKSRTDRPEGEMKRVERMQNALDKMKDRGCPPCFAFGEQGGRSVHPIFQCPSLERLGVLWDMYKAWKASIQYHKHKGICWKCHVPTCGDELHAPLERGKVLCDWPDVVMPLALTVFQCANIREAAQRYFGVVWQKIDQFNNWLMKAPGAGHHSNGMDLVLWYVEEYLK
ncbi:P-loop containing nucleoside triphosphate hydrolase protein [Suillus brevipes Sb2]|nr:P-loop containing nucleoside triphosphate hydrolase protein [Suillus brevipes Sb2]